MTDRERTIKWLECCGGYNDELEHIGCTSECPYWESEDCCNSSKPFQDALALLEEQMKLEPEQVLHMKDRSINETHGKTGFCPRCNQIVVWKINRCYCGFCGKGLIWDER